MTTMKRKRPLIQAPNRNKSAPTEDRKQQIDQIAGLFSELLDLKADVDALQTQLMPFGQWKAKVTALDERFTNVSQRLTSIQSALDDSDVRDRVVALQQTVDAIETPDIAGLEQRLATALEGIKAVTERLSGIDEAAASQHEQNTDTALGVQEENLDMGGHNIVNVEGSEVATKEFVNEGLMRAMAVSDRGSKGGGGGIGRYGHPADGEYARWNRDRVEGRTVAEVKSDLSLDNVENTAHSTDAHTMTIDGRDVSVDGAKLDGIEAGATADQAKADIDALGLSHDSLADVSANDHHTKYTDAEAVTAAKADSDVADAISKKHTQNSDTDLDATFEASIKNTDNHQSGSTNKVYTATEQSKLSGIATGADVTADNAPQAHAVSHQNSGSDEIATATPAANVIPKADASGDLDAWISAASDTVPGKVEIATAAETTTGTDATRAVSPDGLAGSDYGKRPIFIKLIDDATALGTGDGKFIFVVPAFLNGWNLVHVEAHVTTASSSGVPTYTIYNLTDSADMLSTAITIDINEYTSEDAATPAVINGATDDVATGDRIEINKDVAGTGEKGDEVFMLFQLP